MATAFTTSLRHQFHLHKECDAFSLVELMIAVAIVGILGAVALPQYLNQIQKTRQNEAAATVSQIQTTIAAFVVTATGKAGNDNTEDVVVTFTGNLTDGTFSKPVVTGI